MPSRFQGFLLLSGVVIAVVVLVAGLLVGRFFEGHVLAHEVDHTAAAVQSQARQHLVPAAFELSPAAAPTPRFDTFMEGLPGIFRIKVFDLRGRIVWSDEPRLVGMTFPDDPELVMALRGNVTVELGSPHKRENIYEKSHQYIAEVYVPITFPGSPRIVGVIEAYKDTTPVVLGIQRTQRLLWIVAGAMGLVLYVALAFIVWKASANELRAIGRLEKQNRELTLLQQFNRSVLRPLDISQLARSVVESAGAGLQLSRAALYRLEPGNAPALVASWPPGVPTASPSETMIAEATARRERVIDNQDIVIPILTPQDRPAHVFVGEIEQVGREPSAAVLRTLEIMLSEAAIALANVELFTEIREAHERLAAILAGTADRMVIIDRQMRVVWMNAAAAAASSADAVGRTCFELLGTVAEECEGCPAIRTLLSGQLERGVRAQAGEDGETKYFDLITAPLRDASGEVHQVLEVARDITEMVEMEERLKGANQALLNAQAQLVEKERLAAVGQVVVGLHHTILNPLTGILGALEVLKQTSLEAPQKAQVIVEAEEQIRKIERLIRRLPNLQRADGTPYVGTTTMLDLESSDGEEGPPPGFAQEETGPAPGG